MISDIRNPFLRRAAVILTVASIVVCLGPLHLIRAMLRWVEDEFDVDLKKACMLIRLKHTNAEDH